LFGHGGDIPQLGVADPQGNRMNVM
jgi:hypothetical protein